MNKQRLFFKKASALVLCTILLFTCSACFNISNTPKPDSSTGQTFNGQYAETDNEAFAQYVNELFAETVTTDTDENSLGSKRCTLRPYRIDINSKQ